MAAPNSGAPPNGGNWQAGQTVQGNPPQSPYPGNAGALAAHYSAYNNALRAAIAAHASTPEPIETIEDAGIRAGEVIAWRCWRIQQGFLKSAFTETIWAPGEPMQGDTKAHGVHSWKSLSKALEYGLSGPCVVFGQVELWGDIVEHEHGYRAEFAAVKSLDGILEGERDTLASLRKLYSVGGRDDLTPERLAEVSQSIPNYPPGPGYPTITVVPEPEPKKSGAFEGATRFFAMTMAFFLGGLIALLVLSHIFHA